MTTPCGRASPSRTWSGGCARISADPPYGGYAHGAKHLRCPAMRHAAALVLLAALALCASAAAGEDPQYRPNPRDMAAARATVLRASDLGTGWVGGTKKAPRP